MRMKYLMYKSHILNQPFCYEEVEYKYAPLDWQTRGLSYTASGYGARIPTPHMVRYNGKWRRVYCKIYSNIGTLYIGKFEDGMIIEE